MTFTVTYRGKDGALRDECVEATSRAECMAACRRRGIAPTKIAEGGKGVIRRQDGGSPSPRRLTGSAAILAAAVLVVVAVGVWWWMERGGEKSPREDTRHHKVTKPKVEKPKPDRRPTVTNVPSVKPMVAESNVVAHSTKPVRMERGVEVVSETVRTNHSGAVIEKLMLADGRLIEKMHPPKPVFSNPSDQMIALALSYKPGQAMAPLPSLSSSIEDDFARSLLEPIRIEDEDPEEVKALKLAVKETRAYLATEVKNGRSVRECLNEHREQMEQIADSHQMAVQQIRKLKEEGVDAEEIRQFRQRVNEVFRAKGIPELPEPSNKEKKEGR